MSDIEMKAVAIDEVLTIITLLREYHDKIITLPRSVTAARQLGVIVKRLEGWHAAFSLSQQQVQPPKDEIMREVMMMLEDYMEKKFA